MQVPEVVVLESPQALAAYLGPWTALAQAALEPNVFYEPCVLLPSLEALADEREGPLVALVLGTPPGGGAGPKELWGLFPLHVQPMGDGLPLPCWHLWQHRLSYVPIPLVHRQHATAVMEAFLTWLGQQRRAAPALVLEGLPADGPFHRLLGATVDRRRAIAFVRDRFTRALLAPTCDAATYQRRAMAAKHRRQLASQRRGLGQRGRLEFVALAAHDDAGTWLEEFLTLEASGWKGRAGTALLSSPRHARFFRAMVLGAHRAGRLGATAVRLDGRAVAMQILLLTGDGAYAFKMAYDEAFARWSPGVLLELDLVERVASGGPPRWIDSSAVRDHTMMNRVWTERRPIESWVVAGDAQVGLLLSLLPAARWIKRKLLGPRRPRPAAPAPELTTRTS